MGEAPSQIGALAERFERNIEEYRSQPYKETQVRREFIDPFFEALGWDVTNKQGWAETYKEVIHEDAIKVGGATEAPDYCFRIGGVRKFFVEAKKPSVDIKDEEHPAYKLRRYAWSADLALSILTDFEDFAVYDCQIKPERTDKASAARIMLLTYKDYLERWDEIAQIFSKDAVLKGSFDRFAAKPGRKRGTGRVDTEFLDEIEHWRKELAGCIALDNRSLGSAEVTFAVQRTIDRILFLRMCEDRGIEPYGQLLGLSSGSQVYPRICDLFRKADAKYNSGLFYFEQEKGRAEPPDELTLDITVRDDPLKWILHHLYYPQSPYEFSVLPPEILGNVYEQFLGKVIRITPGRQAKIEDKPEVKKAGGVYYTPAYIVDYIVKNTVGKLCEGKDPKDISKLRIVDPACGSGSFLLGAYTFLLNHHRDWYAGNEPEKHTKQIYQGRGGQWFLTNREKKRILLNNIFGVDIDSQAVEVTKLSLLLKVLEGENQETVGQVYKMFHERALPDLGNNIKCGNSLIGTDFYKSEEAQTLSEEEKRRINAFDWDKEFPAVFKQGGFDAVIGNPPWLMAGYYLTEGIDFLKKEFKSAYGKFDLYYLFIEKGWALISHKGLFGMIVPNKFFHTKAGSVLRKWLANAKCLREIVDFGDEQIFSGATNYSCILLLQKQAESRVKYTKAKTGLEIIRGLEVTSNVFQSDIWHFEGEGSRRVFERMEAAGVPLAKMACHFGSGVQSGADRILVVDAEVVRERGLESVILRPVFRGRDVRRYMVSGSPRLLIFPYEVKDCKFTIIPESRLREDEHVYEVLRTNKSKLAKRVWFGKGAEELSGKWYGMMYLDSYKWFSRPHILTPSLSNRSNFALGAGELFATGTAGVTSIVLKEDVKENIIYVLGILNSSLMSFYVKNHSPIFSGGYYKFSAPYLKKLPIRQIDFSDNEDKTAHDKMVKLVERMLELHKRAAEAKVPDEKVRLEREIGATDKQIDTLVYELYGLTDEEIAIVEGQTKTD